jgi:hypothetical protein
MQQINGNVVANGISTPGYSAPYSTLLPVQHTILEGAVLPIRPIDLNALERDVSH